MTDSKLTLYEEQMVDEACAGGGSTVLGHDVKFTALPPALLLRARKRIAEQGRVALEPFREWLIEATGVGDATADTYVAYVWNAIVVTGGEPMRQLERVDLAFSTKSTLKAALKRFAAFTGDSQLLTDLESHKVTRLIKDRKRTKPAKVRVPFSRQEVDAFLGAVDRHRDDPRHPWAWPVLRIIIKLGLRARVDACWIEKESVRSAVKTGALRIWSKREKMRVVPSRGIQEELEVLAGWPYEWEIIADIIAPAAPENRRPRSAYDKIKARLQYYAEMIGVDPKDVQTHKFRHAAALRLYKETGHNLVAVGQLLGHASVETTKRYLQADMTDELNEAILAAYGEEEDDGDDEQE